MFERARTWRIEEPGGQQNGSDPLVCPRQGGKAPPGRHRLWRTLIHGRHEMGHFPGGALARSSIEDRTLDVEPGPPSGPDIVFQLLQSIRKAVFALRGRCAPLFRDVMHYCSEASKGQGPSGRSATIQETLGPGDAGLSQGPSGVPAGTPPL